METYADAVGYLATTAGGVALTYGLTEVAKRIPGMSRAPVPPIATILGVVIALVLWRAEVADFGVAPLHASAWQWVTVGMVGFLANTLPASGLASYIERPATITRRNPDE